jgi:hypothetical protein
VTLALVILRHRTNLVRLFNGSENRLRETHAMLLLAKTIHVLALGLWFGMAVFFTFVVGLTLFHSFDDLSAKPASERPLWFPLPPELDRTRPSDQFPEPLRREQGSRLAGAAVGPMFDWYYGIQTGCGLLTLATALAWWKKNSRAHVIRVVLVFLALLGVAVGWRLERKVEELRVKRNDLSDSVLADPQAGLDGIHAADEARREFGKWHSISVLVNLLSLMLVTGAMGLAAQLPSCLAFSSTASMDTRAL